MTSADLVVVGGGPVGLVTALEARRAGLDVIVVEPRRGPIDKACGQGIMPTGVRRLRELGVEPLGAELAGITYVCGDRRVTAPFRHGGGLGVRRTELHSALSAAAAAAGVRLIHDAVTDLAPFGDTVVVTTRSDRALSASFVVGADGLHSRVRRFVSPRVLSPRRMRRFGFVTHISRPTHTDEVHVHWCEHGEIYLTPLPHGQTGVAILARAGTHPAQVLATLPEIRDLVQDGTSGSLRGSGPFLQLPTRRVRHRMLLVGDAAGYADALTGEGLSVGFTQAQVAVQAITSGSPRSYERAWWRASALPLGLAAGLVTATSASAVRRRVVPAAAALPALFGSLVGLVAGAAENPQPAGSLTPPVG